MARIPVVTRDQISEKEKHHERLTACGSRYPSALVEHLARRCPQLLDADRLPVEAVESRRP